ncbi:hypothetical protein SAMN05421823_11595 [Catalinimonas alkaloidigena]|uniref:Uncharacterized protein n=1 Tax=Catalinimonas alkaloidigena TaxID=1075417 RepID=A0A1G9U6H0_9BACT|nr:hypothetical protein SAMN05421823_11595 [Catalinimonas alkaloidigena]
MHAAFYLIQWVDSFATTTDHINELLPTYLENAGFERMRETYQFKTFFGSLSLYEAKKHASRN